MTKEGDEASGSAGFSVNLPKDLIPPYTNENVSHWLKLVDYSFFTYKITSNEQKVFLLYRALPTELQYELGHVLESPNDQTYELLKAEITKITALPAQRRLEKLLNEAELGDRKPSVFLMHLKQLAGNNVGDNSLVRTIFLNRLPGTISQILAPMSTSSLEDLAKSADQIYQFLPQSPNLVASVAPTYTMPSFSSSSTPFQTKDTNVPGSVSGIDHTCKDNSKSIDEICVQLKSVQQQMQQLNSNLSVMNACMGQLQIQINNLQSNRNESNFRQRSKSREPRRPNGQNDLCYYHNRFGDRATKCQPPCRENLSENR